MVYVPRSAARTVQVGHWPLPEGFWPDFQSSTLPARSAHPVIKFKCEDCEPMVLENFPFDKYELEPSPLTQKILERKQPTTCWQVFAPNSGKHADLGAPFGYLKASTNLTAVNLFVMPYNYPKLLPMIKELQITLKNKPTKEWTLAFEKYLKGIPAYYQGSLKKALLRMGLGQIMPEQIEGCLSYSVVAYLKSVKQEAKIEFNKLCLAARQGTTTHDHVRLVARSPISLTAMLLSGSATNWMLGYNGDDNNSGTGILGKSANRHNHSTVATSAVKYSDGSSGGGGDCSTSMDSRRRLLGATQESIAGFQKDISEFHGVTTVSIPPARPLLRRCLGQWSGLYRHRGSGGGRWSTTIPDVTSASNAITGWGMLAEPKTAPQFRNPFDVTRVNLLDQVVKSRMNLVQYFNKHRFILTGGSAGSRLNMQVAEGLHNLPVDQMGNYHYYQRRRQPALREIETVPVRQHAFGNPFKVDKQRMLVDEADIDNLIGSSPGGASLNNNNAGGSGGLLVAGGRPGEGRAVGLRRTSTPTPDGHHPGARKRRAGPLPRDFKYKRRRPGDPTPLSPIYEPSSPFVESLIDVADAEGCNDQKSMDLVTLDDDEDDLAGPEQDLVVLDGDDNASGAQRPGGNPVQRPGFSVPLLIDLDNSGCISALSPSSASDISADMGDLQQDLLASRGSILRVASGKDGMIDHDSSGSADPVLLGMSGGYPGSARDPLTGGEEDEDDLETQPMPMPSAGEMRELRLKLIRLIRRPGKDWREMLEMLRTLPIVAQRELAQRARTEAERFKRAQLCCQLDRFCDVSVPGSAAAGVVAAKMMRPDGGLDNLTASSLSRRDVPVDAFVFSPRSSEAGRPGTSVAGSFVAQPTERLKKTRLGVGVMSLSSSATANAHSATSSMSSRLTEEADTSSSDRSGSSNNDTKPRRIALSGGFKPDGRLDSAGCEDPAPSEVLKGYRDQPRGLSDFNSKDSLSSSTASLPHIDVSSRISSTQPSSVVGSKGERSLGSTSAMRKAGAENSATVAGCGGLDFGGLRGVESSSPVVAPTFRSTSSVPPNPS
jgi:hypothetical protein